MSIEQAIIKQAYPQVINAKARELFRREMLKGCSLKISPVPVALEPRFCPISQILAQTGDENTDIVPESNMALNEFKMQRVWLAPDEEFSWLRSELFLKHLREVSHRIGFEIAGNKKQIHIRFLVHPNDLPILKAAFRGQFERCEITDSSEERTLGPVSRIPNDLVFNDYFPHPPYSYLLTRPDEFKITTYQSLFAALVEIDPPALGFYQVFFQPVRPENNWHRNVQGLLDLEYNIKLMSSGQSPQRFMQQAPSGDLRQMSWELETKAHNDKPFFSTAIRLGVFFSGKESCAYMGALSAFMNLFQYGGRSLENVTEKEYSEMHGPDTILNMFLVGTTYRPGFLLNSAELSGAVHIPPADILTFRQPPITILETLPIPSLRLQSGTPLGVYEYAGSTYPVCIPPSTRSRSTHIIARPGQVKSTTIAFMALDDFEKGYGGAVIDPHGDLIESLLCSIKEKDVDRTIYFDPGYPGFIPIWNLLKTRPGQDASRIADDLVAAFKNVVTGWGDRLEHLLRQGIYGLLQLPNSTLLDLSNLLRRKSEGSERLRKEIIKVIDNKSALEFWKQDFNRYSNEAMDPPKHKLSKLLVSGNLSLMFSQPESLIDFRQIMDKGKILLINLSNIGSEAREILGCFILSLLHLAALSRSDTPPKDRKNFPIYVDEAHRFITGAMEDIIAELRKFESHAVYAHHYFSQFGTKKIDALSSVGTTIIMNVDGKDASYLRKDLRGLVSQEDLITLKVGEAIARIDTEVVKIKLNGPLVIPKHHHKDAIIQRSLERYYKPSYIIRKFLHSRDKRWDQAFKTLPTETNGKIEEFLYDEF